MDYTKTYYAERNISHFTIELKQTRFHKDNPEHPHSICVVARDREELQGMYDKHLSGGIDWSLMLESYMVLYLDDSLLPADAPLVFQAWASDGVHAQEQCENAYPGCEVVWIVETDNPQEAYRDYYGV